ncbi:MAG: hypothetical protein HYT79_02585 [Elusimicrobia bacterium]|nr:hypothetical protein [Elusimicrobiota bacterium]
MPNEQALRDDNRTPTILYEENGEVRRVSVLKPLPAGEHFLTVAREKMGGGKEDLVVPAVGKRLIVKGVAIAQQPDTTQGAQVLLGGRVIHKVWVNDQSGYVPMRQEGVVGEKIEIQNVAFQGSERAFFIVNYLEV